MLRLERDHDLNDKALRVLCSLCSPNVPFLFLDRLQQFVNSLG